MSDDQGSSNRSEEDSSRPGLLSGLKALLFGGDKEPSLREQIEEVIDEAEEEGQERRGSSVVGDYAQLGGQVGVSGHLTIGERAQVAAKTGVTGPVDADAYMSGYPMMDTHEWRRSYVVVRKLPEMRKQLLALEERLKKLEEK